MIFCSGSSENYMVGLNRPTSQQQQPTKCVTTYYRTDQIKFLKKNSLQTRNFTMDYQIAYNYEHMLDGKSV